MQFYFLNIYFLLHSLRFMVYFNVYFQFDFSCINFHFIVRILLNWMVDCFLLWHFLFHCFWCSNISLGLLNGLMVFKDYLDFELFDNVHLIIPLQLSSMIVYQSILYFKSCLLQLHCHTYLQILHLNTLTFNFNGYLSFSNLFDYNSIHLNS
jgi:hypothetical protein